ncbi:MAG: FG-GAP-like repeat-containing protein [candidate division Zixibacteria bacterium]
MKSAKVIFMGYTILLSVFIILSCTAAECVASNRPYPYENDLIEIMFSPSIQARLRDGVPVDLKRDALVGMKNLLAQRAAVEWHRICDVPEERLDSIHARGEARSGKSLYNLNNIYRLKLHDEIEIWEFCQQLEELPEIMCARPVPKPMPPPTPPDYEPQQGYLNEAIYMAGLGARHAWELPGGTGSGVTICDLEYSWNYNHADISKSLNSQINSNIADPYSDDDHGTAVVGELVSDSNGWGTTGMCYDADLYNCGTYYGLPTPNWNVPGALAIAIDSLSAGDIILIEQQWDYDNIGGYIPIEWWTDYAPMGQSYNPVYVAIETAVANGIHVVEAGGNGGVDTDTIAWYGNSGGIIVGAGGAMVLAFNQRLLFSSYGSRFNLQGWGEYVITTGYGDLYAAEGKDYYYTSMFDGTSSASPTVAGAMACCVGYWKALGWDPALLSPDSLRDILTVTGTPQNTSVPGNIGPRPDLRRACSLIVEQEIDWADVTQSPLSNDSERGLGVAAGDYDNDGDIDFYVANTDASNNLFMNNGDGSFSDVTAPPLDDANSGVGVAWGDYDNDGDLDLYLANQNAANKLFRNNGSGSFSDVTSAPLDDAGMGMGVAWVDYDNDGNLDLFLVVYDGNDKLFQNIGGAFVDVTAPPLGDGGYAGGVASGDYDNDGDQDLYLTRASATSNILYRNDGGGDFTDVTPVVLAGAEMSIEAHWEDFDNDLDLDLYVVNNSDASKMFRNDGGGIFTDVTSSPIDDAGHSYAATCGDYDNDGDLDIYVADLWFMSRNRLYRNEGNFNFVDVTTGPIHYENDGSIASVWTDYDQDGDLDIFVTNNGSPGPNRLIRNRLNNGNSWLHINLIGTVSNKSGIGARVRIKAGGQSQIREITGSSGYCSFNTLTAEFGLAGNTQADSVIINWPSGIVQELGTYEVNQAITITEPDTTVILGDANGDGATNVGDAVYIINFVFKGGPAPDPVLSGDANCDGATNVGDAVYLINFVFKGGPAPCEKSYPTGTLTAFSNCKNLQKTSTASDNTPTNLDCIEYQYDGISTLSLSHINAGFNCCPEEMIININVENNIITIDETGVEGICSCNCLFDLDYEIRNLPQGEYTIIVSERFTFPEEELLEFTVNLSSSPMGSFCVTRNYYPWGY